MPHPYHPIIIHNQYKGALLIISFRIILMEDLAIRRHFSCSMSGAIICEGKLADDNDSNGNGLTTTNNINSYLVDADNASMH